MSSKSLTYASSAAVRRAKVTIEKTGASVTSVRLFPDGTIELLLGSNDNRELSEFDRLNAAGLL